MSPWFVVKPLAPIRIISHLHLCSIHLTRRELYGYITPVTTSVSDCPGDASPFIQHGAASSQTYQHSHFLTQYSSCEARTKDITPFHRLHQRLYYRYLIVCEPRFVLLYTPPIPTLLINSLVQTAPLYSSVYSHTENTPVFLMLKHDPSLYLQR